MAEETTRVVAPKTVADLEALTELKSTEASASYAKFLNTHVNVEGFEISEDQAWCVLYAHRVWQQSDERKAEIAAGKEEAEKAAAEKKAKAEERKAEKAKEAEEKAAAKAKKEAEKAAKDAAEADSDADLDSVGTEGEGDIVAPVTGTKRRTPRASKAGKSAEGF